MCSASSHVNYRFLDPSQMVERMKNLHSLLRVKDRSLTRLQETIVRAIDSEGVPLCDETSIDMTSLMKKYSSEVLATCGEDSFKSIFWKQQMKATTLKNRKSLRWHPLIIKWCLYLHHRSSGAYETLRKSGVIDLPSGRTLRDYRHFVPAAVGYSAGIDRQLLQRVTQTKPSPSLAKYVSLLIDEMHIKEGLVYNKFNGSLTGFVQLDDVSTHMLDYENRCQQEEHTTRRSLAK